jgi:taurine dioxygenase
MRTRSTHTASALEIRPFSTALGAEVTGLDLSQPLDEGDVAAIWAVFLEHLVLVFPDQDMTEAQQVAFCRRFGPVQYQVMDHLHADEHPEIYLLTNVEEAGGTTGRHTDESSLVWHTDAAWKEAPAMATFLYALELPSEGGDTLFADMHAAYEALDDDMKARLRGLTAAQDWAFARHKWHMSEEQIRNVSNPPDHPVVRTHPETGRKGIYLGEHTSQVSGLPFEEGHRLRNEINALATRPEFVYRHHWRPCELVMWDNRCVLHKSTPFDSASERRVLRRVCLDGDRPF